MAEVTVYNLSETERWDKFFSELADEFGMTDARDKILKVMGRNAIRFAMYERQVVGGQDGRTTPDQHVAVDEGGEGPQEG